VGALGAVLSRVIARLAEAALVLTAGTTGRGVIDDLIAYYVSDDEIFLVPNAAHNESYLSFIFVHPDWRNSDKNCLNNNISIYLRSSYNK
jgi:glycine cleavage system aminomethyltransferase T